MYWGTHSCDYRISSCQFLSPDSTRYLTKISTSFLSSINASFWLNVMLHSGDVSTGIPAEARGLRLAWATQGVSVSKDKWNLVSPQRFFCSEQYGCILYDHQVLSDQLQCHNFMGEGGYSMTWMYLSLSHRKSKGHFPVPSLISATYRNCAG